MFVQGTRRGYTRDDQPFIHGWCLVLAAGELDPAVPADKIPLYVAVRYARLRAVGNYLMGTVRLGRVTVTVGGDFGRDGLPLEYAELPPAAQRCFVPCPPEIARRYWNSTRQEAYPLLYHLGQQLLKRRRPKGARDV